MVQSLVSGLRFNCTAP